MNSLIYVLVYIVYTNAGWPLVITDTVKSKTYEYQTIEECEDGKKSRERQFKANGYKKYFIGCAPLERLGDGEKPNEPVPIEDDAPIPYHKDRT